MFATFIDIIARIALFQTYITLCGVILLSKHYRYRLPPWLFKCICILEKAILPILIFQLIRTLIFTTTLDLILLTLCIIVFIIFYLRIL